MNRMLVFKSTALLALCFIAFSHVAMANNALTVGKMAPMPGESISDSFWLFANKVDKTQLSPLMIFLHGRGGIGKSLGKIKTQARLYRQKCESLLYALLVYFVAPTNLNDVQGRGLGAIRAGPTTGAFGVKLPN